MRFNRARARRASAWGTRTSTVACSECDTAYDSAETGMLLSVTASLASAPRLCRRVTVRVQSVLCVCGIGSPFRRRDAPGSPASRRARKGDDALVEVRVGAVGGERIGRVGRGADVRLVVDGVRPTTSAMAWDTRGDTK